MTKEEIVARARDELYDNGITYYSTADLSDSFDDGYEEVCLTTNVLERYGEVALVDDQVYYNLYESFIDYYRVFAIWSPDISDWMSFKSLDYFRRQRADWEKATGNSYRFTVHDFQYISLFPHKSTAGSTNLEIYYTAVPILPILPSVTPEIPEQFQVVLHFYILHDLLAQAEEFTKALTYFNKYIQKREELKFYVNNRSFPDRILMLKEQFTGGSFYGR